ncbi:hypothetical protein TSTA_076690 [Talaromyces stipitatus ATCC 10500]|uniref:Uncharacterized protein n=1 Tax=Talaromyces stipitatus (strain ATCC 10500 / CBS 375.48 / QM 6759 / NRRL 1006) TaxID=441959 RepID=B8LWJ2_TALSN|nr:uncharacterized protein TSTA_076690 [Talaromyces stipitatus ATCC 10500]EED24303.1 hypothetical protein TSTA_076690 [Talaromyces stipitatus ATCC 10500]
MLEKSLCPDTEDCFYRADHEKDSKLRDKLAQDFGATMRGDGSCRIDEHVPVPGHSRNL